VRFDPALTDGGCPVCGRGVAVAPPLLTSAELRTVVVIGASALQLLLLAGLAALTLG
jgi:hypothetical protein